MLKPTYWTLLVCLLVGPFAHALQLQSACYYNTATQEHQDTDPNKKIEIASLSKILVSQWSLSRLGLAFRFKTKLHLTPAGKDSEGTELYDLHFEGGSDPVFTRDRLQYVVALMNNNKIFKLREVSFDENFIYIDNLLMAAGSDSYPHDPASPRTKNNLLQAFGKLMNSYLQTRSRALDLYKLNLPATIKMKYSSLNYLAKSDFQAAPNERVIEIQSVPLKEILFEMNQHSNNHIADFIFQYLGSARGYQTFAQKNLSIDQQNYDVRNGSGNPIKAVTGEKFYNSTSCAMIIAVLEQIKSSLASLHLGLDSIFATVGVDDNPKEASALSHNYSSPITDSAVVAKTGSIDPTIGLAGMLSTKKGDILFAILYGTQGPKEWKEARTQILGDITEVLEKNQPRPLNAQDKAFLSFDNQSFKKN